MTARPRLKNGKPSVRPLRGDEVTALRDAARGLSEACLLPFGARYRALLVGISDNQARINRKALTADQASCNTGFNGTLENPAEHIALTEPLMADA